MNDLEYQKVKLSLSDEWKIINHKFYDIDPTDNIPEDDIFTYIICQEDMLLIQKKDYIIDIGWYGGDLENNNARYSLVLFRGESWNNCELLEEFATRNKDAMVQELRRIIKLVDVGFYDNKKGYRIDENDPSNENSFADYSQYSISKNIAITTK